ncbi:MAG TPA: hypothetical protein VLH09_06670, partial [Bryobacteraceae bacterium]|nr:hypothetical protein [Bryobacteraceae bacterium]
MSEGGGRGVGLLLIIPPGVDRSIFPWGPLIVGEHVERLGAATVSLWDMREDESIRAFASTNRS